MANPEHVRWILEGPDSWNNRRQEDQFTPDLSGVDLDEEFQKAGKLDAQGMIPLPGINLHGANLERVTARRANVEGADLCGTQLRNGNLSGARMKGVQLRGANLEIVGLWDAVLDHADLQWAVLLDAELGLASLREANLSYSTAERAIFEKADLRGANLSRANLEGASLKSAKLGDSRLRHTNLRNSCLDEADLCNAYVFGADLTQSTLVNANLTGANLGGATLNRTDLQGANLKKTEMERAQLDNAYLTAATPWKAVLFRETSLTPPQREEQPEPLRCIEDLLGEIRRLQRLHSTATLYFRGEAECQWKLAPSVMRSGIRPSESEMLMDLMTRRPEEFSGANTALAQWVLAQHHGLRTRFLDITRNPLVALYSACEDGVEEGRVHVFAVPKALIKPFNSDTVTLIANFAKLSRAQQDALLGKETCSCHNPAHEFTSLEYQSALRHLYQLLKAERPNFQERINPRDLYRVFVIEPQQSLERIRAQSGAFLTSAFHERFERDSILQWNERIPVYAHYRLAIQEKREIMKDLSLMNITQETLFPGLDTSAKAVLDLHSPSREIGIDQDDS